MNILEEIKRTIAGAAILKDWLGEGMRPVPQAQADHRSMACISGLHGEPCPHNRAPKWWDTAKDGIAEAMRQQMDMKNKVHISTPLENGLHVCDLCGCCMPLKVHVPIGFIKAHTTDEQITKYPSFCWQKKEMESYV